MHNPVTQHQQVPQQVSTEVLESVILHGDLSKLTPNQRVDYMMGVCRTLGLNPATKPFEFLTLQGKMIMYTRRDCTDQLRKIHGVSITIKAREVINGVYVVTANAQDRTGRCDESTGAVPTDGMKGDNLANALMKAETKAKRRVTLSICGLGLLDETEVETVPHERAPTPKIDVVTGEIKQRKTEWTEDETTILTGITTALKDISDTALQEGRALWKKHQYSSAQECLDAMSLLLRQWEDREQVVVEEQK